MKTLKSANLRKLVSHVGRTGKQLDVWKYTLYLVHIPTCSHPRHLNTAEEMCDTLMDSL